MIYNNVGVGRWFQICNVFCKKKKRKFLACGQREIVDGKLFCVTVCSSH